MDRVVLSATCNACKQLYKDPRILPCAHTFCLQCIKMIPTNDACQFYCPDCKKQLHTGVIPNLIKNLAVETYVEAVRPFYSDFRHGAESLRRNSKTEQVPVHTRNLSDFPYKQPPPNFIWDKVKDVSEMRFCILHTDDDSQYSRDIANKLVAAGAKPDQMRFYHAGPRVGSDGTGIPSLEYMKVWDAVLIDTYGRNTFADSEAMGNVLADYVDWGGGVVLTRNCFRSDCAERSIMGRFGRQHYCPLAYGAGVFTPNNPLFLQRVHDQRHPIMSGVTSMSNICGYTETQLLQGENAQCIAELSYGFPLVAVKDAVDCNANNGSSSSNYNGHSNSIHNNNKHHVIHTSGRKVTNNRVVALNAFAGSSDYFQMLWDRNGDGSKLLLNSLYFAAGVFDLFPG